MAIKKILLINQGYINGNLGDQAIRVALSKYFKDSGFDIEYSFLTNAKSKNEPIPKEKYINNNLEKHTKRKRKNKFLIFLSILKWIILNIRSIYKTANKDDYKYVIIGGGQLINSSNSFYPHNFSYSIFLWSLILKFLNKKIVFLGIGANKKFNRLEKYFYQYSLENSDIIFVRDMFSKLSIKNTFGVDSILIPDTAFYDSKLIINNERAIFSISIYSFSEFNKNYNNKNLTKEEYYSTWIEMIERYKSLSIHLFSTTTTDYFENINFYNYAKSKLKIDIVIEDIKDLESLDILFSKSKYVFSARMHAILIAYKNGCIPIVYEISDKLTTFKKEFLDKSEDPIFLKNDLKITLDKYFNEIDNKK